MTFRMTDSYLATLERRAGYITQRLGDKDVNLLLQVEALNDVVSELIALLREANEDA